ncbi:PAS domain S-box protein [Cyanobacteria bacterium FACHB-472]|nr:PAS domain S-box protein [Cyanobacteria bacterium FACHB-472]
MTDSLHRSDLVGKDSPQSSQGITETALRQSQEFNQQLLDSSDDCIKVFDLEGRILFMNQGGQVLLGIQDITLFLNTSWVEFWQGAAQQAAIEAIVKARDGEVCTFQGSVLTLNSELKWWDNKISPIRGADGQVERLLCISRDITKRRQAEEAWRESEAKYRTLFESIDEGFCTVEVLFDADGKPFDHRILQANPAFKRQTGLSNPEGKRASELVPGVEQYWNDLYAKVIHTGESIRTEVRSDALSRWFDVLVSRVGDAATRQVAIVFTDISDRKQAELEIQKFVSLADNSGEFIGICDMNFVPFYVNSAGQQLVGLDDVQQYIETSVRDFFFPEDQNFIINEFLPRVLQEGRAEVEIRFRHFKTGAALWMIYNVFYIRGENNQPIGLATVSRNITERKQTEATLQEQTRLMQLIIDSIGDGLILANPQGEFVLVNQAAESIFGSLTNERSCDEWSQTYGLFLPDQQTLFPNQQLPLYRAIQGEVANDVEVFVRRDPTTEGRWVSISGFPVRDQSGDITGGVITCRDITDRKQAEAVWRESENRLRLALESAELGTWDFNPITGVLRWDDPCKAAFGLLPESEINYDVFLSGLHPDDRDRTDQVVQFALNPESNGEFDIEYRTIGLEDGVERWIAAKGKAFFNPAGIASRFIGTVLNITEKKRIEAEREHLLQREQAARETAEKANRIKDEFLAVLSHELRSPLNPILGWSRLLQNRKLDPAKTQMALKTIERNAQLQADLIEDLLDVSRILQGKLNLNVSPLNLVSIIQAAMETVRLAAEAKSIQVEVNLEPEVGLVAGDSTRLQQVIWNLLSNAVKFTPQGGLVSIRLERLDSHAYITVSDTGQGIKSDFLPYVFDYFRQSDATTTRKFGGLGLGLAIVRNLVELHGGTVRVESPGTGMGATFIVKLPLMPIQPSANQNSQLSEPNSDLNGIQVLVVDDEPDSREFVAFVLELAGAKVMTAATAAEALTMLMRSKPTVLLSDIGMPDMDGYMLMQQVRALPAEQGGQVRAIALTAYAGDFNQQQALQAGFQQHLSKPIEPEKLVTAISRLLNYT